MRYRTVIDGIPEVLESGATGLEACCACGLVHEVKYKIIRGRTKDRDKIEVTCKRMNGITRQRRKMKTHKEQIRQMYESLE